MRCVLGWARLATFRVEFRRQLPTAAISTSTSSIEKLTTGLSPTGCRRGFQRFGGASRRTSPANSATANRAPVRGRADPSNALSCSRVAGAYDDVARRQRAWRSAMGRSDAVCVELLGVTSERDLAAVVAHGLLNTAAVISGSAHTLRFYGERLSSDDRMAMMTALSTHSALLDEGLRVLLEHCSDPFGDAATVVALTVHTIAEVSPRDLPFVLDGLIDRIQVLTTGLQALVRGLRPEVVALLESLPREGPACVGGT